MTDLYRDLTGLSNGTTYEFRITAIGDGTSYTNSSPSSVENFTTLIPLTTPSDLVLEKTTSSIKVEWTPIAHASGYKVSYVTGNGAPVEQTVYEAEFTLSNIAQGATYSFKVMALGDGTTYEDSAYSVSVASTTLVKLATPQPTVDSTTSSVSVEWDEVPNADGYRVSYKAQGGAYAEVDVGSERRYAVSGLAEGVTEIFKVQAYTNSPNVYEDSEYSAEVTETTQITLAVPVFTLTKTTGSITATWSAVQHAASYTIAYKLNGSANDFTEVPIAGDQTSYTLPSLNEGVTYDFKIKANSNIQDYVDSPYSTTQSETTLITLATPSAVVVSNITSTSARIAWTGDDNASSFKIEYRVAGSSDAWSEI